MSNMIPAVFRVLCLYAFLGLTLVVLVQCASTRMFTTQDVDTLDPSDDNFKPFQNWSWKDLRKLYRFYLNTLKEEGEPEDLYPSGIAERTKKTVELAEKAGHLRFGKSLDRIKYADPDYGHMRFGK